MAQTHFNCPHCDQRLRLKPEWAGRTAKCPACREPMTIPIPSAEEEAEQALPELETPIESVVNQLPRRKDTGPSAGRSRPARSKSKKAQDDKPKEKPEKISTGPYVPGSAGSEFMINAAQFGCNALRWVAPLLFIGILTACILPSKVRPKIRSLYEINDDLIIRTFDSIPQCPMLHDLLGSANMTMGGRKSGQTGFYPDELAPPKPGCCHLLIGVMIMRDGEELATQGQLHNIFADMACYPTDDSAQPQADGFIYATFARGGGVLAASTDQKAFRISQGPLMVSSGDWTAVMPDAYVEDDPTDPLGCVTVNDWAFFSDDPQAVYRMRPRPDPGEEDEPGLFGFMTSTLRFPHAGFHRIISPEVTLFGLQSGGSLAGGVGVLDPLVNRVSGAIAILNVPGGEEYVITRSGKEVARLDLPLTRTTTKFMNLSYGGLMLLAIVCTGLIAKIGPRATNQETLGKILTMVGVNVAAVVIMAVAAVIAASILLAICAQNTGAGVTFSQIIYIGPAALILLTTAAVTTITDNT